MKGMQDQSKTKLGLGVLLVKITKLLDVLDLLIN